MSTRSQVNEIPSAYTRENAHMRIRTHMHPCIHASTQPHRHMLSGRQNDSYADSVQISSSSTTASALLPNTHPSTPVAVPKSINRYVCPTTAPLASVSSHLRQTYCSARVSVCCQRSRTASLLAYQYCCVHLAYRTCLRHSPQIASETAANADRTALLLEHKYRRQCGHLPITSVPGTLHRSCLRLLWRFAECGTSVVDGL